MARADRIAQETRALLHHSSDDEPHKPSAVTADIWHESAAYAGADRQHNHWQADVEPTAGRSPELTLKLSSSSDHAGSAGAAGVAPVGPLANGSAMPAESGFPAASATSEPPLTLVLTPNTAPTPSSTEAGLSLAATVPGPVGEQLTLVLSPDSSSRARGTQQHPSQANPGANATGAGGVILDMVLSSDSGAAHLPHADASSEIISVEATPLDPSFSCVRQQNTSQPDRFSTEQQLLRNSPDAHVEGTARPVGVQSSAKQCVRAGGTQRTAASSPAGTPEAPIPLPQGGMQPAGPETGGSVWRRTPEESPLPLGQPMPAPLPRSATLPMPRTGALLRAALAPEGAPGTGGGQVGRNVRRRMSSLLARASSDHLGTPDGPHAAAAGRGAQRWGQKSGLSTIREAPDGPGIACLREPPPTQVFATYACSSVERRVVRVCMTKEAV